MQLEIRKMEQNGKSGVGQGKLDENNGTLKMTKLGKKKQEKRVVKIATGETRPVKKGAKGRHGIIK